MLRDRRLDRIEVALLITVLLVFAGTLYLYARPAPSPAAGAERVQLAITENARGDYAYNQTRLQVPAGSVVQFTVTNFDPGNHSVRGIYCNVTGTQDGMMQWMRGGMMGQGGMSGAGIRGLSPDQVSHTFTIWMNGYQLNVPIPPAQSATDPSVVTFTVQMFGSGALTWQCDANDMGPSMGPEGGMMGVLAID